MIQNSTAESGGDPITFEILSNKLWAINDEAAATVGLVSGSPVATEVHDFNTSLMDAEGNAFTIGMYIAIHAATMTMVVKHVIKQATEDSTGINEGDQFYTNDPYIGACHQCDAVLVAPIHYKGVLIGWTGATMHQTDVGGPKPGQVQVGAQSIFEEQPVVPPVKLIEKGMLRKDIERVILRPSRLPEMYALNLRSLIAANNVAKKRVLAAIDRYGTASYNAVVSRMIEIAGTKMRARLSEFPDGIWRSISYLDYDPSGSGLLDRQEIYATRLVLTKKGDSLTFDFTDSDPQAPAVINSTFPTMNGSVLVSVLTHLCWDIPWSPAGVLSSTRIESRPGTVCHAEWPAGCSKNTTSANFAVRNACTSAISRILMTNEKYHEHVMAQWAGAWHGQDLLGRDQRGQPFGTVILDSFASGCGARSWKDGIDSGGFNDTIKSAISNVESQELLYPILYLFRRQAVDTGGPGKFRGGVGISYAYTVYNGEITRNVMHAHGIEMPESTGLAGGYPSSTIQVVMKRHVDFRKHLRDQSMAGGGDDEILPAISMVMMEPGSVLYSSGVGGGGYGDPIEREPALVLADYRNGLVTKAVVRETYGVMLDHEKSVVDDSATKKFRDDMRKNRMNSAKRPLKNFKDETAGPQSSSIRVNEYLSIRESSGGRKFIGCTCGKLLSPADENYKEYCLLAENSIQKAGPQVNPHHIGGDRFVFREYFCPGCGVLLDTEVARRNAPLLWDTQLYS